MRFPRPTHSGVVAYLALLVALSGTAVAADGGVFLLGRKNIETQPATLIDRNGPTVNFRSPSGTAPFTVNQATRVDGLNADQLDGLHASAFQRKLEATVVTADVFNYNGSVQCPSGWTAVGGGYSNGVAPTGQTIRVDRDSPSYGVDNRPTGWSVWAETDQFQDVQRTIYAVCVR